MNCETFELQLNEILDNRDSLQSDPNIVAHADACECCRELLDCYDAMLDGEEFAEIPALPEGFAANVMAELTAETPAPSSAISVSDGNTDSNAPATELLFSTTVVQKFAIAASLAALLCAAIAAVLSGGYTPNGDGVAMVGDEPGQPADVTPGDSSLAEQQGNATPNALPAPDGENLAETDRYRVLLANLTDNLPATGDLNSERIPAVKPLATSFTVAFTLLRETITVGKEDASANQPQGGASIIREPAFVS